MKLFLYKYVDNLIFKSIINSKDLSIQDTFNPCKYEIVKLLIYILNIKELNNKDKNFIEKKK